MSDLVDLLSASDASKAYGERLEAELDMLKAERSAELAALGKEAAALDARLRDGLVKETGGALDAYPADLVMEEREGIFAELSRIDGRRKALEIAERAGDELTPGDFGGGLRFVMGGVMFAETDQFSDRFRAAFNRIVESVVIQPGNEPGQALARVSLDLGPLIGSADSDDPDRRVVRSIAVPVFGPERYQRGMRADPTVAYRRASGDLPDRLWSGLEPRVRHAMPTLTALGWTPRGLIDAVRLVCAAGMGGRQRDLAAARGPIATFDEAGRALIRSGALAAVVDALDGTSHAIGGADGFMPSVMRPGPAEVAERIRLSRAPKDRASSRREVVALVLDGLSPVMVGAMRGLPAEAVRELVRQHHAGTLLIFGLFDLRVDSVGAAGLLREAAEDCLDPAIAMRLRAASMRSAGFGTPSIAMALGWTMKTASKWIGAYEQEGPARLWMRGWCLRPHDVAVDKHAKDIARSLAAAAAGLPRHRRAIADAVAAWCSGASAGKVLGVHGGSAVDFDRHLAEFRSSGVEGLTSWLRRPEGESTAEGKRLRRLAAAARDAGLERRLLLLADFADGRDVRSLAAEHGTGAKVVEGLIEAWRDTGEVHSGVTARAERLGRSELEALAAFALTSGDPDRPRPVTGWAALLELCVQRFGHVPDPETFRRICRRHGIRVAWRRSEREHGAA